MGWAVHDLFVSCKCEPSQAKLKSNDRNRKHELIYDMTRATTTTKQNRTQQTGSFLNPDVCVGTLHTLL